ncbi:DUF2490 domain-containing protein [Algoriphagus mannitolivorans]|uniref:DUF2490 domain-containing protein n=1 Tax=Algoriphagus mannitolivorans TaxID=226504 RepID=UPI00047BB95A|nr:DUF2490 domain-containing protein [Algoriphagus mannitolivorans]
MKQQISRAFLLGWMLIGISSTISLAQEPAVTQATGLPATTEVWNGLYLKLRLSDKWWWYQENHYRRRSSLDNRKDFVGRMGQVYNRFGMTYLFTDNFEVTFGPTLVYNYTPEPGNPDYEKVVLESRLWHQWLFTQGVGRVKVLHQFRFEHRFKRTNDIGADYQYTDRFRYKFTAYVPLNTPKMQNKTLFIAPSNEIFMETGKSKLNIFEENRLYTAIGYTYNNFMFFGGHMWTYGPTSTLGVYRNRHILRFNVMYTVDFRGKRKPLTRDFQF